MDAEDYLCSEDAGSYSESLCKDISNEDDEEVWIDNELLGQSDPQEMPKAEPEEDLYSCDPDVPEHPDVTKNPEISKEKDEEYNWPTTGMASPIAEEY